MNYEEKVDVLLEKLNEIPKTEWFKVDNVFRYQPADIDIDSDKIIVDSEVINVEHNQFKKLQDLYISIKKAVQEELLDSVLTKLA